MTAALAAAPPRHVPCRAWSRHAEDLAARTQADLDLFDGSPTTHSQARDGLVVRLRTGVYAPLAALGSMPDRAVALGCALGPDLRPDLVIAGASAAWVCLGGAPPRLLGLISLGRPASLAGVHMRQAPLAAGEVEAHGGCPVTVPGRTALDLLRFADPRDEAETLGAMRRLLASGHVTEAEVSARLARAAGLPHLRRAQARWEAALTG